MRRASGFTVLEMMIVIAIIGIVSAIALPSFRYLTSTTKVKSASTELYLGLIRARNEAVKRNRLVSFEKTGATWAGGWRVIADADQDGDFDSSDTVVAITGAQARVTISSDYDSIVFLTSGRTKDNVEPAFGVTSEETASMQRCISADLTGKPFTKEGACP